MTLLHGVNYLVSQHKEAELTVQTDERLLPEVSISSSAGMCVITDEDTCAFPCIRKSNVHIQDTSDIEHPEEGKRN
jgi:hypothetical protein